jgi:hypothetical protein
MFSLDGRAIYLPQIPLLAQQCIPKAKDPVSSHKLICECIWYVTPDDQEAVG